MTCEPIEIICEDCGRLRMSVLVDDPNNVNERLDIAAFVLKMHREAQRITTQALARELDETRERVARLEAALKKIAYLTVSFNGMVDVARDVLKETAKP
jgi:predicted transcriptional regulator